MCAVAVYTLVSCCVGSGTVFTCSREQSQSSIKVLFYVLHSMFKYHYFTYAGLVLAVVMVFICWLEL
jgi:hypothetical protein